MSPNDPTRHFISGLDMSFFRFAFNRSDTSEFGNRRCCVIAKNCSVNSLTLSSLDEKA